MLAPTMVCTQGVEPVEMRAGADRLLARVVQVFGCAQAHHSHPRDVLERLPSHPNSRIEEFLPPRWLKPTA